MVDICSFSASSTTTILALVLALAAASLACQPGDEPLPSIEGCGLDQNRLGLLRSEDVGAAAPPLSKGMWAG